MKRGCYHSEETKRKISESCIGKSHPHSEESKRKLSEGWEERKKKVGYVHPRKGIINSDETRKRISKGNMGKVMSLESRKKQSETRKRLYKEGKLKKSGGTILKKYIGICIRCKQEELLSYRFKMCKYCIAIRGQVMKLYNLTIEEYDEITKKCLLCGFDKIVSIHHLNGFGNNSSTGNSRKDKNAIGLCPNHHRLLHSRLYGEEINKQILQKLNI